MTRWIVITDLDGTLLDANTYQPGAAAREALRNLQARDIPVVFCSAKTHAEQEPLRSDLAVADPFIVENGSALIMPDGTRHVLGVPVDAIHERLDSVRKETGLAFQTYQDIGLAEVAGLTGLTPEAAERACQRDYSATVVTPFSAAEMARFQQVCAHHGLQAPSGGRFITVTGSGADKGQAVRLLRDQLGDVRLIGIGDSHNDAPMLAAVDEAYLVQRPGGSWHPVEVEGMQRVAAVGPTGWAQTVNALLNQ